MPKFNIGSISGNGNVLGDNNVVNNTIENPKNMNYQEIIEKEAIDFFDKKNDYSHLKNAIENFHLLKNRLRDFYTPENKAIFLNKIEYLLKTGLQSHRFDAHGRKPDPTCQYEIKTEKLLFYIRQELDTLPAIARQRFQTNNSNKRTKVFVSYSHLDKNYLEDMKRHFRPFLKEIDFWDDSKILPGQNWKDEIQKAIRETKIAILLVSTDFLGSEFIITNELPPLLEAAEKEGAIILTIILKPCLFESFPKLNQFQAMNPPNKPVSKMNENEKEELYVNLVRQTKSYINE